MGISGEENQDGTRFHSSVEHLEVTEIRPCYISSKRPSLCLSTEGQWVIL